MKQEKLSALKQMSVIVEKAVKRAFPEIADLNLHVFDYNREKTYPRYLVFSTLVNRFGLSPTQASIAFGQIEFGNELANCRSFPYMKNCLTQKFELVEILTQKEINKLTDLRNEVGGAWLYNEAKTALKNSILYQVKKTKSAHIASVFKIIDAEVKKAGVVFERGTKSKWNYEVKARLKQAL